MKKIVLIGLISIGIVGAALLTDEDVKAKAEIGKEIELPMAAPHWWGGGQEVNGYYWVYTDNDCPDACTDPVTGFPVGPPGSFINVAEQWEDGNAVILDPTTDDPKAFTLPDSFWFFGKWYQPMSPIYISPNGWISLSSSAAGNKSLPPDNYIGSADAPNALIAPAWHDWAADSAEGPDGRILVSYDEHARILAVEWDSVYSQIDNSIIATFEVQLYLGGPSKLYEYSGCGYIYSTHYIDFYYMPNADVGASPWATIATTQAINTEIGIEDESGANHYLSVQEADIFTGMVNPDFQTLRFVYRRVFDNDLLAFDIIAPDQVVLRWTPYQPIVVISNMGRTLANSYGVTITIKDLSTGDIKYERSFTRTNLYYPGSGHPYMDTIYCDPVWDSPEEIGTQYEVTLAITGYDDECMANNTFVDTCVVGCDYTFTYPFDEKPPRTAWGWRPVDRGFGTTYLAPARDGADSTALVIGGEAWIYPLRTDGWRLEVWDEKGDCGLPTRRVRNPIFTDGEPESPSPGWNTVYFKWGDFMGGYWAKGQNIWMGWIHTKSWDWSNPGPYLGEWDFFSDFDLGPLADNGCIPRGSYDGWVHKSCEWDGGMSFAWWYADWWGTYGSRTFGLRLISHLGLKYPPVPPAYFEKAHDLAIDSIMEPTHHYVEAGATIVPKCEVVNLGRQIEKTTTGHPIEVFFYVDTAGGGREFEASTVIDEIGCGVDDIEGDEFVPATFANWVPNNVCDGGDSLVYDLLFIVKLNKVGPDNSDHCPYNDTVKIQVVSLWSHDAAVREITSPEVTREPDTVDISPGESFTPAAIIANTGYYAEPYGGARFAVTCEIKRVSSGDIVYHSDVTIDFLNWRGNDVGDPWTMEVVFPTSWTVPDEEYYRMEVRVELDNDQCALNNAKIVHINPPVGIEETLPERFELSAVKPNPFMENALVEFAVPYKAFVSLKVYDASGKVVKVLHNGDAQAGYHRIVWDGRDDNGRMLPAGIYFIRMESKEFRTTRKVILAR